MFIKKISKIKNYKSYRDYSWDNYCLVPEDKNSSQGNCKEMHDLSAESVSSTENKSTVAELKKFNVIFGENGTGKTSISEILKSLSNYNQDLSEATEETFIKVIAHENKGSADDNIYQYIDKNWDNKVEGNDILFFDNDYVNRNVHTHGERSNEKDKHAQNSGNLIINLDGTARGLQKNKDQADSQLHYYQQINKSALDYKISDSDKIFYGKINKLNLDEKEDLSNNLEKDISKMTQDFNILRKNKDQIDKIKSIRISNPVDPEINIFTQQEYKNIFSFGNQLREIAAASDEIKNHFNQYESLITQIMNNRYITENFQEEKCPVCRQDLKNAADYIQYYLKVRGQSYRRQNQKYLNMVSNLNNQLQNLKRHIASIVTSIDDYFNKCEQYDMEYSIGIYSIENKNYYVPIFISLFNSIIQEITNLEISLRGIEQLEAIPINKCDFTSYHRMITNMKSMAENIAHINQIIARSNIKISSFKQKYQNPNEVDYRITKLSEEIEENQKMLSFLRSKRDIYITQTIKDKKEENRLKEAASVAKKELHNYLEEAVPKNMKEIINEIIKDNFKMKFEIEPVPSSDRTKQYALSFNIKDEKGQIRKMSSGLSEGERQAISISFFFAMSARVPKREETILVFDDPTTSLDASNLKKIADLIHKESENYAQLIVLTHHPLFYKYLTRNIPSKDRLAFSILKNKDELGGSFMFVDKGFDPEVTLAKMDEYLSQTAKDGELSPEKQLYKYGALLRLALESFIKNDLLRWHKEGNFEKDVIEKLSSSKSKIRQLSEPDIDNIKKIYRYCNQSNIVHVGGEGSSGINELRDHIRLFFDIKNKSEHLKPSDS